MTVFRGYMTIISRNLGPLITYLIIFIALVLMINSQIKDTQRDMFKAHSAKITVIDEDGGARAKALTDFLKEGNSVKTEYRSKADLVRDLYTEETEYVVKIPKGFTYAATHGKTSETGAGSDMSRNAVSRKDKDRPLLKVSQVPGSTVGFYLENSIEQYMREVDVYTAAGFSETEAQKKAISLRKKITENPAVNMETVKKSSSRFEAYVFFFRLVPYLFLSLLIYAVAFVFKAFSDRGLRGRISASPVTQRSRNLQSTAAFAILFGGIFAVTMCLPMITGISDFYAAPYAWIFILNALCMLAVGGSIAILIGRITKNDVAVSALSNIISLGMCFMGGCFIDLSMLSSKARTIGRLLPVYWYERTNDILGGKSGGLSGDDAATITRFMFLQLAFAFVLTLITFIYSRYKNRDI